MTRATMKPSRLFFVLIIAYLLSAGGQTAAEIEELSLRTSRPVAIYLCESAAAATTHD
ncbi:hypothetical protein [Lysinibacillus sp. RC79]|uniref:hypothetical protein n=1 Tax=Lysinibacillus sp. RC79 TaxID=3156296 RepID=UPI0035182986